MIIYNVTVSIDKEIEKQWFDWMKNTHIATILMSFNILVKTDKIMKNTKMSSLPNYKIKIFTAKSLLENLPVNYF